MKAERWLILKMVQLTFLLFQGTEAEEHRELTYSPPAKVWRDAYRKGDSLALEVGKYDKDYLDCFHLDDQISSLYVQHGYTVELCVDSGFHQCRHYTYGTNWL